MFICSTILVMGGFGFKELHDQKSLLRSKVSFTNLFSGLVPQRPKASDYDNPGPDRTSNVYPSAVTAVPSTTGVGSSFCRRGKWLFFNGSLKEEVYVTQPDVLLFMIIQDSLPFKGKHLIGFKTSYESLQDCTANVIQHEVTYVSLSAKLCSSNVDGVTRLSLWAFNYNKIPFMRLSVSHSNIMQQRAGTSRYQAPSYSESLQK
ncbi:hypothetical protein Tco_1264391 [Tanacetum coccineum]